MGNIKGDKVEGNNTVTYQSTEFEMEIELDKQYFSKLFGYTQLPSHLQPVSKPFHDLAVNLIDQGGNHEFTRQALMKLWEAKNLAVTANGFMKED